MSVPRLRRRTALRLGPCLRWLFLLPVTGIACLAAVLRSALALLSAKSFRLILRCCSLLGSALVGVLLCAVKAAIFSATLITFYPTCTRFSFIKMINVLLNAGQKYFSFSSRVALLLSYQKLQPLQPINPNGSSALIPLPFPCINILL